MFLPVFMTGIIDLPPDAHALAATYAFPRTRERNFSLLRDGVKSDLSARRVYLTLAGAAVIAAVAIGSVLCAATSAILLPGLSSDVARDARLDRAASHPGFEQVIDGAQKDKSLAEKIRAVDDGEVAVQTYAAAELSRLRQIAFLATAGLLALFGYVAWTIRRHMIQLADRTEALQGEIAERKQAEAKLQKFSIAVEQSPATVVLTDVNGTIEYVNPRFVKTTGYTREEAIGQNPRILKSGKWPKKAYKNLWDTLLAGNTWRGEFQNKKKDGQLYWESASISPIRDEWGVVTHFLAVKEDITARKRTEKELRQAKEVAEAADLAKSEFLANMSHEIRTPMTAIVGFSDILLESKLDREHLDAARIIKQNGAYLIGIINDILDLSKIQAGKLEVEHVQCSPYQILAEVAALMRVRADAKNLPLEVEFDGPIPRTIQSDSTRLRQILINLTGNAIKFTEVGQVRLVVRLLHAESERSKIQFDVEDTGVGIAKAQVADLFQPFQQADSSTTRKFGGSGLGLTISKRLARKLGGDIDVKSVYGAGSTFSVTVDTGSLEGVSMLEQPIESVSPTDCEPESAAAAAKLDCRVLLAEDGPDNQRLIAFLVRQAGAEVEVVENGKIALDDALAARDQGSPFDVILMDMQMPVMDGYDATGKLRQAGYTGPIIALTAHAMSTDRDKCIQAGCDDYMAKPIERKKLIAMVAAFAARQKLPQGGPGPAQESHL